MYICIITYIYMQNSKIHVECLHTIQLLQWDRDDVDILQAVLVIKLLTQVLGWCCANRCWRAQVRAGFGT